MKEQQKKVRIKSVRQLEVSLPPLEKRPLEDPKFPQRRAESIHMTYWNGSGQKLPQLESKNVLQGWTEFRLAFTM
jgi:hypothetical protein